MPIDLDKGTQIPTDFLITAKEEVKFTGPSTETVTFTSNSGRIVASKEVELKAGTYTIKEKDTIDVTPDGGLLPGSIFSAEALFTFTYEADVEGKYRIDKSVQWHDIQADATGDLEASAVVNGNVGSRINGVTITVAKDPKLGAGETIEVTVNFDGKIDKTTTITLVEAKSYPPELTLLSATPSTILGNGKDTSLLSVKVQDKSEKGIKSVVVDLSSIGGLPVQPMFDDGTNGDATAGDGVYSLNVMAPPTVSGGSKNLQVTATDNNGNSASTFISLNITPFPAVTGIAPNWSTRGSKGVIVTISGQNFSNDITAASIEFSDGNGISVTNASYLSNTQIKATINIDIFASIGKRYVSVTTGGQTGKSETPIFDIINGQTIPPIIVTISPDKAYQGATLYNVEIFGSDFVDGATVSFSGDGISVNSVNFVNSGKLGCNLSIASDAPLGARDLTVTNPDGMSSTLHDIFTIEGVPVVEFSVDSVVPDSGIQDTTSLYVVINGQGFSSDNASLFFQSSNLSFGSGITVNMAFYVNETKLAAYIAIAPDAVPGARDVSVIIGDETAVGLGLFTVKPKSSLLSATPDSGNRGALNMPVLLKGNEFKTGATVDFGAGITVNSAIVESSTQMTANISISAAAALGVRDVQISNPGETPFSASVFEVLDAPSITGLTPESGNRGSYGKYVTINGANFVSGADVAFGSGRSLSRPCGISVNNVSFIDNNTLRANIDIATDATLGYHNVTVANPGGVIATLPNAFEVKPVAPIINRVNPSEIYQGETTNVSILGANFKEGANVAFSGLGVAVNSVDFVSASELKVNITVGATAPVGPRDVTVTNPDGMDGSKVAAAYIKYPPPEIIKVDPDSGIRGTLMDVSVQGDKFRDGARVAFSGAGISINSATTLSATKIQANITIADDAPLGYHDVIVTNPDGSVDTKIDAFTVNQAAPTITGANPASGSRGTTMNVSILGAHFQSGAGVTFNCFGISINSNAFVSSTKIQLGITILGTAPPGSCDVTVTNPDGNIGTKTNAFTVKSSPTITDVSPAEGRQGATMDVSISGADFQSGASVAFSGDGITVNSTNVISSTRRQSNITIASDAPVSIRDVTVTNTDGGSYTKTGAFMVMYPVGLAIQDMLGNSLVSATVGDRLDLRIWLSSPSTAVSGASAYLTYDDSVLSIIDQDTNKAGMQPFAKGTFFGGINNIDNDTHSDPNNSIPGAQLDYVEVILGGGPTGEGILATFSFDVIAPALGGSTIIRFDFDGVNNRSTSVSLDEYGAVTPVVTPAVISMPVVTVEGEVLLQGRTPNSGEFGYSKDVTFELRNPNDTTALSTQTVLTNFDGSFSVSFLGTPGVYDVTAKTPGFLRGIAEDVTLPATGVTFTPSPLLGGNCNDDNAVDIADFSLLSAAFGSSTGAPNFNPNCDFDGDNAISLSDFAILAGNFGTLGMPAPKLLTLSLERENPFFTRNAEFELRGYSSEPNNHSYTIDVKILAKGVERLYGYSLMVSYDQTLLELSRNDNLTQMEGSFLRKSGQTLFFTRAEEPGKLLIVASLIGDSPGVAGTGTIAQLRFKTLDNKLTDSYIELQNISIVDVNYHVTQLPPKRLSLSVVSQNALKPVPSHTRLLQNFPNPFNPETWIPFALAESTPVTIRIYAANGQLIRTLDLGNKKAGFYHDRKSAAHWDGKDVAGEQVASGIYFYQLKAGKWAATRKMLILK